MLMNYSVSVVIPVYNSSETLIELHERVYKVLSPICKKIEIIFVNDGSRDGSWEVIRELKKTSRVVHGINLMRNYGQHNALLCGIRHASNEFIVTMDDDLQHLPEEIPLLLDKLNEGHDVVYGVPVTLVHSGWRNFFSKFTKKIIARLLGIRRINYLSAFRAFRSEIRKAFDKFENSDVIIDALLTWGTDDFDIVEVKEKERKVGHSNYNFWSLIKFSMVVFTGFSTIPLRFSSVIGFFLILFGIGVFIYVIVLSFQEGSVPGFPFLASIISIFSGAQLFTLGVFGEYLGRMFNRSMNRPSYTIEETID
jgi:glycosyltransferase involved in cell wall biosynthesis